jgi:hypothetical protein
MAFTPGACVTAIAALIATVPKSGRVHAYRRAIRSEPQLKALLWDETEARVCGWMISPSPSTTTVSERHPGHHGKGVKGGGNVMTTFQFQIEGYFGIDDAKASEMLWRDLTWAVASECNAYGLLNIAEVSHQLPCDVDQFGYASLAGFALVHYARLSVGFTGRTRPSA